MTYNGKEYVKQLISTIDKKKSESFKKAKEYLESIKFYEKKSDEIKEFLVSEEGLILLEGMSTDKLTILSISDCLRISQKEFHKLMRENAEIYDAIDRGSKADLDEANKALLMLVTGYYKTETKDIIYKNERGGKATQTHKMEKWFPPQPYANTYYHNNKMKMEYQEKQIELEETRNTILIKMTIIGDDELNVD